MIDGTAQRQRQPAAWAGAGFLVDEMELDRRVQVCARLAERLSLVDLNDHEVGTWDSWFDHDPSLVLARIAAVDRYGWQTAFLGEVSSAPVPQLAQRVFALARLLDGWLHALGGALAAAAEATGAARPAGANSDLHKLPPAAVVSQAIEQLIERQLAGKLVWMAQRLSLPAPQPGSGERALSTRWTQAAPDAALPPEPDARAARAAVRSIFFAFLAAVAQVRELARRHLADSLPTGHHEPAAGLLLAFLGVYETVGRHINAFADRHIDFYYHRVLGLRARASQADRVHVVCLRDAASGVEPLLPAGTAFVAGKDIAGEPLLFRSERPFAPGRARVAVLATLRLMRDRQISPEADLGYVTGIKAQRIELPMPGAVTASAASEPAAGPRSVPLFGGGPGSTEARLGLVAASPLLMLAEGHREIVVDLRIGWPGATPNQLFAQAHHAKGQELRTALGRLFARWMLGDHGGLTEVQYAELLRCIEQEPGLDVKPPPAGVGPPLYLMCAPAPSGGAAADAGGADAAAAGSDRRDLAFFTYVRDMFEVTLTHAEGWFDAPQIQVSRPPADGPGEGGLRLTIALRPEDPPICGCIPEVHGAQWRTRLPLLQLRVSPRARLHPYSLFDGARLHEMQLRVNVRGARDVVVHNNVGPLDPSKAFTPFGPLPTTSSYLVLGSPEAARKNLAALKLHVEWGGLPSDPGGFAEHYRSYRDDAPELATGQFTAALSLLRDGQWQPCGGASADQPLFTAVPEDEGRLSARQVIEVDAESLRLHARASEAPLVVGPGARDGLLKLQLARPRAAFGHAAYPALLAGTLSAQARRRRKLTLPNAPYTPVIESLSVDYSAVSRLRPGEVRGAAARRSAGFGATGATGATGGGEAADAERLLHIHPFGVAELLPDAQVPFHGVLPQLGADGSLALGLQVGADSGAVEPPADSQTLGGPLSLLFQLRADEAAAAAEAATADGALARGALAWSYLAGNHWRALGQRHVQADGTEGLMTSGIVQLDLPEGACRGNTVLDAGLFWLRVARGHDLDAVAPLVAVHAQALTLVREIGGAGAADAPLPAGRIAQGAQAHPGLAGAHQPEASYGWRPAEDTRQFRVRVGERLRHKNRASLGWDLERLVLEAFPEVFKVKCLGAGELPPADRGAGLVRVVVVPHVHPRTPEDSTRAARLNASTLARIRAFLAARCSPFAQIVVHNPSYERVQVRCRIQLDRGLQGGAHHAGAVLRQVNRALVEFISPWHDVGAGARFGWELRCDELQAVVRAVPGVQAVGALSLLHLMHSDGGYELGDTAPLRLPSPQFQHARARAAEPPAAAAGLHVRARGDAAPAGSPGAAGAAAPAIAPVAPVAAPVAGPTFTEARTRLGHRAPWSLALPMPQHLVVAAGNQAGKEVIATGVSLLGVGRTFVVGGGAR